MKFKALKFAALASSLYISNAFAGNAAGHIKWMWDGYGPCEKKACITFLIAGGLPPSFRGMASPHDCVVNAVKAMRGGEPDRAIRWIQAGQLHNGDAMKEIAAGRNEVLSHLMEVYDGQVPKEEQ